MTKPYTCEMCHENVCELYRCEFCHEIKYCLYCLSQSHKEQCISKMNAQENFSDKIKNLDDRTHVENAVEKRKMDCI